LVTATNGFKIKRHGQHLTFKFNKRRQQFTRSHDETLSVVAVRVNNPDRSPVGINRSDTAQTPPGCAEEG